MLRRLLLLVLFPLCAACATPATTATPANTAAPVAPLSSPNIGGTGGPSVATAVATNLPPPSAPPTVVPPTATPAVVAATPTVLSSPISARTPVPVRPLVETPLATDQPTPVPTASDTEKASLRFDGGRAYQHALDQCSIGPRPPGTPAIQKTRDYIKSVLRDHGWTIETDAFTYDRIPIENIIGKKGSGPVTILGAHYDTRSVAEKDPDPTRRQTPILGGNDGASGVAVLLELARVWAENPPPGETWLTFFDAEDTGSGGIPNWPWLVGSDHMARNLSITPKQVIVVDMIGDTDQQIYLETTSYQPLLHSLFNVAHELGYNRWFIRQPRWSIFDDHSPFLQRGFKAVDLIDFDYPYHHTFADDCTKIAPASLERVGRTLELFMNRGG